MKKIALYVLFVSIAAIFGVYFQVLTAGHAAPWAPWVLALSTALSMLATMIPAWLGLAAKAAFARGDRDATVRHLWRASQLDPILSFVAVTEIRERADETLNAQLDAADVPRECSDLR